MWVATNIHLDQSCPLRKKEKNGSRCVECLHEMGKLLLNLVLSEPLSLVQELAELETRYSWICHWRVFLIYVSMIQSVVACSMQSRSKYVGVICFAMYDVSSNCGKYGRRQSTLNTRCMPRNGGMLR